MTIERRKQKIKLNFINVVNSNNEQRSKTTIFRKLKNENQTVNSISFSTTFPVLDVKDTEN